jgi:hypothetical protein
MKGVAAVVCTAMLLSFAPQGEAADACYHPAELRADAEAQLAAFLQKAALMCSGVLHGPAVDAWNDFTARPEVAAAFARADTVRAGYYKRLYGGEDWERRWHATEFAVVGYGTELLQASRPSPTGCYNLTRELTTYQIRGWPAYSATVDRLVATLQPQVQLCEK